MGKKRIGRSVLCLMLAITVLCPNLMVYGAENERTLTGQTGVALIAADESGIATITEDGDGTGNSTGSNIGDSARDNIGDSTGNNMGDGAGNGAENNIGDSVGNNIEDNAGDNTDNSTENGTDTPSASTGTDSGKENASSENNETDSKEEEPLAEEPKKPGWEAHEDGTWSYYDQDGKPVTGWIKSGSCWYYIKPETNRTAKSETLKVGNALYFFRENGVMVANGWAYEKGIWYLAKASGALLTGWQKSGNHWYYMEPETGKMLTGFQDLGGETYLFSSSGARQTGWKTIDGSSYYFRDDGAMKKSSWQRWNGGWYYLQADGRMAGKGWLTTTDGKKYYMTTGGLMASGWQKIDEKWYYFGSASDGQLKIGWQKISGRWYYLNPDDGAMTYDWQLIDGEWYYLSGSANDGAMQTGWKKLKDVWYYFGTDGAARVGFHTIDNCIYFFDENCMMLSNCLLEVEGQYYLLTDSGAAWTGWLLDAEEDWYYFDEKTGAMKTGWQKIGNATYYLGQEGDGAAKTGWQEIDGKWYYFGLSSCAMRTGWLKLANKWYYLDPSAEGAMVTGWQQIGGKWYYFYESGVMAADTVVEDKYYVNSNGVWVKNVSINNIFNGVSGGQKTIKNLLQNAMKPVGSTLYIWGGGHDTGTNGDATRYGVNPEWSEFYLTQDSSYNYNNHRWKYGKGLDCSGFVGWAAYNTIYNKSNQSWTVTTSSVTAKTYANKGWGTLLSSPGKFKAGDVVSMSGHTYIVIGQCSDGSLVLVHATPPAVQISGTCTPGGNWSSEAIALARSYMKTYYPGWYFTPQSCGTSYFTNVTVNRWSVNGTGILTDPDGYQDMSAKEVLADLFEEETDTDLSDEEPTPHSPGEEPTTDSPGEDSEGLSTE